MPFTQERHDLVVQPGLRTKMVLERAQIIALVEENSPHWSGGFFGQEAIKKEVGDHIHGCVKRTARFGCPTKKVSLGIMIQ